VSAHQAQHPVATMCRVLEVSASGYHAWRKRPASKRAQEDGALLRKIRTIHEGSRQTYGVPRVVRELRESGVEVGRDRVARLMRTAGLQGVSRRRFVTTTQRDESDRPAPDLVERRFEAEGPNQLWVADITYIPTWAGFLYLAVVLDVWSRKVVGWTMATHLRTELVLEALQMAIQQRRPCSVIHHSDQGCQYTSFAFGKRCEQLGVRPSMGSVGDAYDNAMAESFFATLECELLERTRFETQAQARSRSSSGSRAGTTRSGVTRRSGTDPRTSSSGATRRPENSGLRPEPRSRTSSREDKKALCSKALNRPRNPGNSSCLCGAIRFECHPMGLHR